jgi:hypothetical protein
MAALAIVKLQLRSHCSFSHFRNGIERKAVIFIAMIIANTIGNWKAATSTRILEASKQTAKSRQKMTSSMMTYSGAAIPSFFAKQGASCPGLSLRDWLSIAAGALAMASSVPSTGRISSKQVDRLRAVAASI